MTSKCQWCVNSLFMESHLEEYLLIQKGLSRSSTDNETAWCLQAYQDLQTCFDCVITYHTAINEAFQGDLAMTREEVYLMDIERLKNFFSSVLGNDIVVDVVLSCFTPLKETLKYPLFLLNEPLAHLVVEFICTLLCEDTDFHKLDIEQNSEIFPGIYLLLIHPVRKVQRWAIETVKSLDPIDSTTFEDIEIVMKWLMSVMNFGLIQNTLSENGEPNYLDPDSEIVLPSHLIPTNSRKTFWVGICMLIKSMDKNCIKSNLFSSTSIHRHLLEAIFKALEQSMDEPSHDDHSRSNSFWPVLQIISVLLQYLEAHFWQLTSKHPAQLCKMILGHLQFANKLQYLAEQTEYNAEYNVDCSLSNSQIVYASSNNEGINEINDIQPSSSDSVSTEIQEFCCELSWIPLFVSSIVSFGDVFNNVLKKILTSLYSMFIISISPRPQVKSSKLLGLNLPKFKYSSKITITKHLSNVTLEILSQVIEILFLKEFYKFLVSEIGLWLPIFTLACTALIPMMKSKLKLYSGFEAIRKVVFTIINCPIGQELLNHNQLFVIFSPNLSRTFQMVIPQLPPHIDSIKDNITTVLHICLSRQDVVGPFVSLSGCEATAKRHQGNYDLVRVKQETVQTDMPSQSLSQPSQVDDTSLNKTQRKSNFVKRETNDDQETDMSQSLCQSSPVVVATSANMTPTNSIAKKLSLSLRRGRNNNKSPQCIWTTASSNMDTSSLSPMNTNSNAGGIDSKQSTASKQVGSIQPKSLFADEKQCVNSRKRMRKKSPYIFSEDETLDSTELKNRRKKSQSKKLRKTSKHQTLMQTSTNDVIMISSNSDSEPVCSKNTPLKLNDAEMMSVITPVPDSSQASIETSNTEWFPAAIDPNAVSKFLGGNNNSALEPKSNVMGKSNELSMSSFQLDLVSESGNSDSDSINNELPSFSKHMARDDTHLSSAEDEATIASPSLICKIPLLTQKGNQQSSINGNSDIVPLENIPTTVEQNTAQEANSIECSDEVLMLDKDLIAEETGHCQPFLEISSDEAVNEMEISKTMETSQDNNNKCIYNKAFRLPSCASVGREIITQPLLKPVPVQLNIQKMSPTVIENIIEDVRQGRLRCLPAHTRYTKECEEFIINNQGIIQDSEDTLPGELVVSIDLPLKCRRAIIIQNQLSNQQCSSKSESTINSQHGEQSNKSEYTINKTKQLSTTTTTNVRDSSANIAQSQIHKTVAPAGVISRPKFSSSRLPFITEISARKPSIDGPQSSSSVNNNSTSRPSDHQTKNVAAVHVSVDTSDLSDRIHGHLNKHHHQMHVMHPPPVRNEINKDFYRKWSIASLLKQVLELPVSACTSPSDDSVLLVEKPSQVPDTFSDWTEYYQKLVGLSLIELQNDIALQLCEKKISVFKDCSLLPPAVSENVMRCQATISKKWCNNMFDYHLVKIDSSSFGIASRPEVLSSNISTEACQEEGGVSNQMVLVEFKLRRAYWDPLATKISISPVLNLTQYVRQWTALQTFEKSKLMSSILYPKGGIYFGETSAESSHVCSENDKILYGKVLNVCQNAAVESAVNMVAKEYIHPRILLIKGYPGTGKTHAIVSMVNAILKTLKQLDKKFVQLPGAQFAQNVHSPRILLCAPSNSALDEIIRILIKDGVVYNTPEWRKVHRLPNDDTDVSNSGIDGIRVVRFGDIKRISDDVKCVFSDSYTACNKDGEDASKLRKLRQEIDKHEASIIKLKERELRYIFKAYTDEGEPCANGQQTQEEVELSKQINERIVVKTVLLHEMKELKIKINKNNDADNKRLKQKLHQAELVCCTLSTCGRNELHDYFKNPMHFNCVIIDEASYCSEIDTILPISFGSTKLILVGDPTGFSSSSVKSKMAINLGLGRSMFDRINQVLNKTRDNYAQVLKFQYRMSAPLCSIFASYGLYPFKTATCLKSSINSNLIPFRVFDIQNGATMTKNSCSGKKDEIEILGKIVSQLLEYTSISQQKIGIITPYKMQEREIQASLRERFRCKKIEIGNTEEFQGREKTVIILFCVKDETASPSGFLANTQKMAIALTRASEALYIIAKCESLAANKEWNSFINLAKTMDNYTKCSGGSVNIISPDTTTTPGIVTRYTSPNKGSEFSNRIHDPRQKYSSDKYRVSLYNSADVVDSSLSTITNTVTSTSLSEPQQSASTTNLTAHYTTTTSQIQHDDEAENICMNHVNMCTNTIIDHEPVDHEPVEHWPDSQSIIPPQSDISMIDYNRKFSPPPLGSMPSHHGGPKTRIAHTSTVTIQQY